MPEKDKDLFSAFPEQYGPLKRVCLWVEKCHRIFLLGETEVETAARCL